MKKTFVNFSNHPIKDWEINQITEAKKYGELVDLQFPEVSAEADEMAVSRIADQYVEQIMRQDPAAVMCQGEYTLTFQVVKQLRKKGIPVFAACSERKTELIEGKRLSEFSFVRFRLYE